MGQEKERLIEDDWQRQKREREKQAEDGYVPPIRPPEFDRDDD